MPDHESSIDAIVHSAMDAFHGVGLALGVVHDDRVVHLKGYGVKQLTRAGDVTPDSLFACASTTKAFTTALIARLVEQGKMSWDDPVRKWVDYFRLSDPLADSQVTVRDLVCHRTGLSRHDMLWYRSSWGRDEILRKVAFLKPSSSFRSRYEYQNIMFLAAGESAGIAAGQNWDTLMRERILGPLGMDTSNTSATDAEDSPDHVTPHREYRAPGERKRTIHPLDRWLNFDNIGPAGTLNASAREMCEWLRLQLGMGTVDGKTLISSDSLAETHAPHIPIRFDDESRAAYPEATQLSYALGWTVMDYFGRLRLTHTGGIDGFCSRVVLFPREKLGLVILVNLPSHRMRDTVANAVADLFLGIEGRDWLSFFAEQQEKETDRAIEEDNRVEDQRQKDAPPSSKLESFEGEFQEPAYGPARVALERGKLRLQWSSFNIPLSHYHHNTFVTSLDPSEPDRLRIFFPVDGDGAIMGMRLFDVEFRKT